MSMNKFIICTNAKRSQIESTETHYKIKGIPITINDSVMNGVLYSKEENAKGIPSIVGKPFTIDHPADENGNFISALEGNGLMDYFSGGVVTNAYEVDDVWYADAEIKKSLLAGQNNGQALTEKLEGKSDLGVSTGLYFENNQVAGANAKGEKYSRVAMGQNFNHLAAVDNPAGGKGTTAVFNSENTFVCNFDDIKPAKEPESKDKRSIHIKAWNAAKKAIGFNALSHEDIRRDLNNAINPNYPENHSKWVMEVYNDYFIYVDDANDGDYFQLSYSISDGGVMVSGEPEKVERKFVKAGNFANDNQNSYNNTDLINQDGERAMRNLIEAKLKAAGIEVNGLDEDALLLAYNEMQAPKEPAQEPQTNSETPAWAKDLVAKVNTLESQLTANAEQELDAIAEQVEALKMGINKDAAKAMGLDAAKSFLAANSAEYVADYAAPRGRASQTNSEDDGVYRSSKPFA